MWGQNDTNKNEKNECITTFGIACSRIETNM